MGTQNEPQHQTYRARPEPGQLVEVRRRQWVVADVNAVGLETVAPQHCVRLSSLDEDGLGEELEVIWEIEPGAQIIKRAGLPSITGQDDSSMLDAFLDAVRWGAATNAAAAQPSLDFGARAAVSVNGATPSAAILDFLKVHDGWHAKADVLATTGITDGQWNAAITDLIASSRVERQGDRRGARYRIQPGTGANNHAETS